ncbi:ABC transporter substrate-binding protein [Haloarcula onubensis]|uniref:ABC transporter substrate-binding protein n=1 Tax=Haloarcula onubensis TaxID=2950539 RepID=A0ABU2FJK9_9EURY|nr:ABC transporter substrate-binding protein [Halomicroarcula sp. S3CR25-11]MDS0280945.1 ABC transporter substrate-binding protein [Halomicroarcula sp. S3CR25-11]
MAGLTGGLAATSGCLSRIRALVGRNRPTTVALSIKTLPVDQDPYAIAIARQLSAWFEAAGIRATIQPITAEELYRQTLVNHEYDVFVGQYPGSFADPDAFYSLLHSTYSVESGMQNPFGYTNLLMDDLLERQRRETGRQRTETVTQIQRRLVQVCPFLVLGFPNVIRAARTDRFTGWNGVFEPSPVNLLTLNSNAESATRLRATTPDDRPMTNLNPLMSSHRGPADITDLLYDSLAYRYRGTLYPWAATNWEWTGEDPLELDVTLRDNLTWHDDQRLTASDAAFTYRLLRDTSLGSLSESVPTFRFRGRSSLVEQAEAVDDVTVRIRFTDCSRQVARRVLTVPVLPEHVWADRTDKATVSGVDVGVTTTDALVTSNIPPVGSGPLEFTSVTQGQTLVLERFDDHFIETAEETGLPSALSDGLAFEEFELQFVGSDSSAVDLIANDEADVTALGVGPDLTPTIGRARDVSLNVDRSGAFYYVGFNTRRPPLTNPRFRNTMARLVDRDNLAASVFDGYVDPAVSPLAGTPWLPADLAWEPSDPAVPFLGTDGSVDTESARKAFRAAGYRYNEQGRLLQS